MTQTTLNGYRVLFVTVPEGGAKFNVMENMSNGGRVLFTNIDWYSLPPGKWQLMGTGLANEVKDGDVPEGMVEYYEDSTETSEDPMYSKIINFIVYTDYLNDDSDNIDTLSASLLSFVRAQGCEPERTVLLYEPKNK